MLLWLGRYYAPAQPDTEIRLGRADSYFTVLELFFILAFFVTIGIAGTIGRALAPWWLVGWLVVIATLIPGLRAAVTRNVPPATATTAIVVRVGVFLMRLVVIFSAQY